MFSYPVLQVILMALLFLFVLIGAVIIIMALIFG